MKSEGFSLVEVMVTVAILTIGLLGLVGLQTRGVIAQKEAYQRAQALSLLKDMASRIQANRTSGLTGAYVATGANSRGKGFNGSAMADCSAMTQTDLDLCEWHNGLLGSATGNATLSDARGCIESIAIPNTSAAYRISVAWRGYAPTVAPLVTCGQGNYGPNDAIRRVVTMNVALPNLGD
jgi:type IV pilus assembly protein PilV